MFSIVIGEKGGAERRESFEQASIHIGRIVGNEVVLPKGNVSKRHCRIELDEGRFVVTDLNSTNGTYVNRRRITQSTVVREGDRIYVGDFVLRLEAALAVAPNEVGVLEPSLPTGPGEGTEGTPPEATPGHEVLAYSDENRDSLTNEPDARFEDDAEPEADGVAEQEMRPVGATPPSFAAARFEAKASAVSVSSKPQRTSAAARASLVNAVRFLVERVSGKLEPSLLEREMGADSRRRVERLVEEVLASLRADQSVPEGVDDGVVKAAACAELLDLGPLGELLDDPSVQEITVAGGDSIRVVRAGQSGLAELPFCAARSVQRALQRLCRAEGQALSGGEKLVQRELATIGFELDALTAAASPSGAVLHLRRRDPIVSTLDDLIQSRALAPEMATFLSQCMHARTNILVVGVRGGGYTQVLAALAEAAPGSAFSLRDEWELAYHGSSIFPLSGEGDDLRRLLTVAQRFSTHHWLVDGLGAGRAAAILGAIGEGMTGVVAGIKGRSLEHGLALLKSQLSLSGAPTSDFGALVAACFDLAVEVVARPQGLLITRIAELSAADSSVYPEDIFSFNGQTLKTSARMPRIAREANARGIPLGAGLFDEL